MKTILVVDDNTVNLLTAEETLSEWYNVITLASASIMFDLLKNVTPDLILLDILMPDMDGFEALKKLKENPDFAVIPVIFLTSKSDAATEALGFEMGVIDYISKPFSGPVLLNRLKTHLDIDGIIRERTEQLRNQTDVLTVRTEKLLRLQNSLTSVLASMVENRDKLTGKHIERTAQYIKILMDAMLDKGLYGEEMKGWNIEVVVSAGRLHDIGKIAVSDIILNKPGKLSPEEYEMIKTHSAEGERIINDIINESGPEDFLLHARYFAGSHHERWNGTGYPRGLAGEAIPLQGRILAVADVYDALVSDRPYKTAFTHEKAVEIIKEERASHFDPHIVDIFLSITDSFREVCICQ